MLNNFVLEANNNWGPQLSNEIFVQKSDEKYFGRIARIKQKQKPRRRPVYSPFFYRESNAEKKYVTTEMATLLKVKQKNNKLPNIYNNKPAPPSYAVNNYFDRRREKHNKVLITKRQKLKSRAKQSRPPRRKIKIERSIAVQPGWEKIDTISFSQLTKQSISAPRPELFNSCGKMRDINIIKTPAPLPKRLDSAFTSSAFISSTFTSSAIKTCDRANVFAADNIISLLMVADRTVYPWDLKVSKRAGKIFLSARNNSNFHKIRINENSNNPPTLSDNKLSESTRVDYIFSQQKKDEYIYNIWNLGDDIKLLIRSNCGVKCGNNIVTLHALTEYNPKSSKWSKLLNDRKNAVIINEFKNNSALISRWCIEAYMIDAYKIYLGFVSKTAKDYIINTIEKYKTSNLFTRLNLKLNNLWGAIKFIIKKISLLKDGEYIILRKSNDSNMEIYKINN